MLRPAQPYAQLPLPLLITGVSGVPGYNALHYFQARYPGQVFGQRQTDNVTFPDHDVVACDLEDREGLARLFDRHRFAAVLDCAGNCALKPCELNPELAWRINVEGVRNLVAETAPRGIRLVHLSVDMVFSGNRDGGYTEDDPTDPVTIYGKTMVAGEQVVLEADPSACVLRISLPMGISFGGHAGAIDWITSRFKKGRPATLFTDEIRTPTYTDCMNALYETALAQDLGGLYHAGGPRRLSLYQIAQLINRLGGYDSKLLWGLPRGDAAPIPPRAGNVSMDSTKLIRALGYDPFDPWPFDDALVPTDRNWHHERPAGEPSSPQYMLDVLACNPARRTRGGLWPALARSGTAYRVKAHAERAA
ncbi:MAG: SDR family oxidoreductase [Thermoguttaceae bacterium]